MRSIRPIVIIICVFAFRFSGAAQSVPDANWIRVQTDEGELSIEVPDDYSYFFDPDGFVVAESQNDYTVRDVNLLNAYSDGALLSVETYRADGDAMKALLNATVERGGGSKKVTLNGIEMRQVVRTENKISASGDNFYFVSRYFKSNKFIYVVSGMSRNGVTPAMSRFFESLRFDPAAEKPITGIKRLSELKGSPVTIKDSPPQKTDNGTDRSPGVKASPSVPDPADRKVIVASKARASYVDRARKNNVVGAVRLRLVLNEKGYIPSIEVVTGLPDGLTRQAIFAALRVKFLPAERSGKPVPVLKTLEYTFAIY